MSNLRKTAFHRALHRSNLILGGERELVMFTALLTGGLVLTAQNLITTVLGVTVWFVCIAFLRMMAKADPYMSHVYIRSLKFQVYYPGRSRPFRSA
jgi:type IV secretion system protein TrbD